MSTRIPTRFPKGVTNVEAADRFNLLAFPDPTKWITYFTDFADAVDSLPNATDANYVVTKTGAGTIAQTDGVGGLSLLTNAAGIADAVWVQKKGEAFKWQSDKKLMFGIRFKVSDATQSVLFHGLQITDNTPVDVTDGIYFTKADEATAISFVTEKDDVPLATALSVALANDTFIELAFVYNPAKTWRNAGTVTRVFDIYVNGVLVASQNATTTVPDDEDLTVSFGIQNGEAVAKNMTIDWVFAALER